MSVSNGKPGGYYRLNQKKKNNSRVKAWPQAGLAYETHSVSDFHLCIFLFTLNSRNPVQLEEKYDFRHVWESCAVTCCQSEQQVTLSRLLTFSQRNVRRRAHSDLCRPHPTHLNRSTFVDERSDKQTVSNTKTWRFVWEILVKLFVTNMNLNTPRNSKKKIVFR